VEEGKAMNQSHHTTENIALTSWSWIRPEDAGLTTSSSIKRPKRPKIDLLQPLRHWLDNFEVRTPELARKLCQLIPTTCPFERDIQLFGRTLFRIPPLCKLNPLYEQVVALRFRALCYLADECGEDVTMYC
jgi:hypothetical protein